MSTSSAEESSSRRALSHLAYFFDEALSGPHPHSSNNNNNEHQQRQQRRCPLVYSPDYNIRFFGIESCHPFDARKWGRVVHMLIESGELAASAIVCPKEARPEDLQLVHTDKYLRSLRGRSQLARILEVGLVLLFPTCLINQRILRPMRLQTGGTVLAARMALDHGWAINVGGGFHHASSNKGGGFCVYADITLAIRLLLDARLITSALIVDLDAHQGNGHERDFADDYRVYILDMFNVHIYPHDEEAKRAITRSVPLGIGTGDREYLGRLREALSATLHDCPTRPGILIYNAGTDSLAGDPLGLLRLTPQGIAARDEAVFRCARDSGVPIAMVTSGGYTRGSAHAIAGSILNLHRVGLIDLAAGAGE